MSGKVDPMEKRPLFQRVTDFLFGYDFFISYCWADGREYALELHRELEELGFQCFLDSSDYAKGDNWRIAGKRALKKTSRLVLVGTPKAVLSEPVTNELKIFSSLGRRVFPIDFENALSGIGTKEGLFEYLDPDLLRVSESNESLKSGPSAEVLQQIRDSFNIVRQDLKRTRVFAGLTCLFAGVAAVAILFFFRARTAEKEAILNAKIADENRSDRDLETARLSLDKGRINEALRHFWGAYTHAPEESAKKESARKLIHAWLPSAGREVVGSSTGWPSKLSPDGLWALATNDEEVYLTHTASGEKAFEFSSIEMDIRNYTFSPDSAALARLSGSREVELLKLENTFSKETKELPLEAAAIALRNQRELFLIGANEKSLLLYDLLKENVIRRYPLRNTGESNWWAGILISPDGERVMASNGGSIGYWNIETNEPVPTFKAPQIADWFPESMNADGSVISVGANEETDLMIADTKTGDKSPLRDANSVSFHPGAPRIAAISTAPSHIEIRESNPDNPLGYETLLASFTHHRSISTFQISKNGKFLVAADDTNNYKIWTLPEHKKPVAEPQGQGTYVVSEDFRHLIYRDGKGNLSITNIADGTPVSSTLSTSKNQTLNPHRLIISPDESTIAVAGYEDQKPTLFLFQKETGSLVSGKPIPLQEFPLGNFFNRDSSSFYIAKHNGGLFAWDARTGEARQPPVYPFGELETQFGPSIFRITSAHGDRLAVSNESKIEIWNLAGLALAREWEKGLSEADLVRNMELSEKGKLLAYNTNRYRNTITVLDIDQKKESNIPIGKGHGISHIRISEEAGKLAVLRGPELYLYQLTPPRRLHGPIRLGENEVVVDLEFNSSGSRLAMTHGVLDMGFSSVSITQWDVESGFQLGKEARRTSYDPRIAYAPDDSHLLFANMEGQPVEKWGSFNEEQVDPIRTRMTLELLSGLALDDPAKIGPLDQSDESRIREEIKELGSPLVEVPMLNLNAVDFSPQQPTETDPSEDDEPWLDMVENWVTAGNSSSDVVRSQLSYYADPATIDGKLVTREKLESQQKSFVNAFPERNFTLQEAQEIPAAPESGATRISVLQQVRLIDSDGEIRELEIRDEIELVKQDDTHLIRSRDRVYTHDLRALDSDSSNSVLKR